ncbi:energy transducer TonB [Myxococcota bacterium]
MQATVWSAIAHAWIVSSASRLAEQPLSQLSNRESATVEIEVQQVNTACRNEFGAFAQLMTATGAQTEAPEDTSQDWPTSPGALDTATAGVAGQDDRVRSPDSGSPAARAQMRPEPNHSELSPPSAARPDTTARAPKDDRALVETLEGTENAEDGRSAMPRLEQAAVAGMAVDEGHRPPAVGVHHRGEGKPNPSGARRAMPGAAPSHHDGITARRGSVAWKRIRGAIQRHVVYPRLGRRMGWQGRVLLGFDVRPDGGVDRVRVLKSSGYSALDRSALTAIARAAPLPESDRRLRIELPIVFALD